MGFPEMPVAQFDGFQAEQGMEQLGPAVTRAVPRIDECRIRAALPADRLETAGAFQKRAGGFLVDLAADRIARRWIERLRQIHPVAELLAR
jgi:hypothetical protein